MTAPEKKGAAATRRLVRSSVASESRGCAEACVCYEVIRVRYRDGFHIGGRFIEAAEVYPRSESWGKYGFTFTDKDAAFAKLRELA
jgi:hypothetical protein